MYRRALDATRRWLPFAAVAVGLSVCGTAAALNVDRLTPEESVQLQTVLATLNPLIEARRAAGTAALLTWEELYAPLTAAQRTFLDDFRTLRGAALGATAHYFGAPAAPVELVPIEPQTYVLDGAPTTIDRQYLPRPAYEAYQRMMAAMEADLGRRLLVESGYRSPAYQLYLFLYYLPTHDDSIRETNRYVALPGHSEHGHPPRQALDFISLDGINGEEHPEEFEALPEYAWLQRRAHAFGFYLSYPRGNTSNTAFEPWHWHFTAP